MEELKPCPFCGYEKPITMMRKGRKFVNGLDHIIEQHKWYVQCPRCKARGSVASGKVNPSAWWYRDIAKPVWQTTDGEIKSIAVKLWNVRVDLMKNGV